MLKKTDPTPAIEIRTGVPLPENGRGRGKACVYPFAGMAIGNSFWLPCNEGQSANALQRKVSNAARAWQRNHPPAKFATRQVDGGVGVWRTK